MIDPRIEEAQRWAAEQVEVLSHQPHLTKLHAYLAGWDGAIQALRKANVNLKSGHPKIEVEAAIHRFCDAILGEEKSMSEPETGLEAKFERLIAAASPLGSSIRNDADGVLIIHRVRLATVTLALARTLQEDHRMLMLMSDSSVEHRGAIAEGRFADTPDCSKCRALAEFDNLLVVVEMKWKESE